MVTLEAKTTGSSATTGGFYIEFADGDHCYATNAGEAAMKMAAIQSIQYEWADVSTLDGKNWKQAVRTYKRCLESTTAASDYWLDYGTTAATTAATSWDECDKFNYYVKYDHGNSWKIYRNGKQEFIAPPSPKERLKEIIRQRHAPNIIVVNSKRRAMSTPGDIKEQRARQTLLFMIGEDRFRRFLKDGFVTARNRKSGFVYQIFTDHTTIKVFDKGKKIADLCVVLQGRFPPTDQLMVRYLLALNDEDKLWKLAGQGTATRRYNSPQISVPRPIEELAQPKPLPVIFAELKKKAKVA